MPVTPPKINQTNTELPEITLRQTKGTELTWNEADTNISTLHSLATFDGMNTELTYSLVPDGTNFNVIYIYIPIRDFNSLKFKFKLSSEAQTEEYLPIKHDTFGYGYYAADPLGNGSNKYGVNDLYHDFNEVLHYQTSFGEDGDYFVIHMETFPLDLNAMLVTNYTNIEVKFGFNITDSDDLLRLKDGIYFEADSRSSGSYGG